VVDVVAGIVNETELTASPVLLWKLKITLSPTPPEIEQFGRVYEPCAFSVGVHPGVVASVVGLIVTRVGGVAATWVSGTSSTRIVMLGFTTTACARLTTATIGNHMFWTAVVVLVGAVVVVGAVYVGVVVGVVDEVNVPEHVAAVWFNDAAAASTVAVTFARPFATAAAAALELAWSCVVP
jgi:hypothetical protein